MKKTVTITIVLSLLLLSVAMGAETTTQTTDTTKVNLQEIDYKTVVIQENAKTQAYIKQELAKRDADMEKKIYKYVDDNFAVLDDRIDGFVRKATFKLGMVFLSGMVLGGSILMLISRSLKKKRIGRKHLTPEETKGVTRYTTLEDETINRMKDMREGKNPAPIIKEQLRDLQRDLIDDLAAKKAGINDYLRLKETGDAL